MNIVFALTYFDESNFAGGTQSLVKSLSNELTKSGNHIVILNINHNKKSDEICIKKYDWGESVSVPSRGSFPALIGKKILASLFHARFPIKKRDILDCLESADALVFFDVNEMSFPFFLKNTPLLKLFYCCTLIEKEDLFKRRLLAGNLLRKASDLYIASNVYTGMALERLGIESDKVKIIPYGINVSKYSRIGELPFDERRIGFLGGIEHRKGIHLLIKACSEIQVQHSLVIAGQIRDSQYSDEIKTNVDKLNGGGFCKAEFAGRIPDEGIMRFFSSLSIFVCPSLAEEFGIVILEAMACEVPVIASSTGGIRTIIEDGKNGLLFESGNPHDLKDKINLLLSDGDYARKLARNGRETVENNYSIKNTASELKSYIERNMKVR